MTAKYLWNGSIEWDSVSIPVGITPAAHKGRMFFNILHERDRIRLESRIICPKHHKAIKPRQTAPGYEYGENQYVVLEPKEVNALEPERAGVIQILKFMASDAIDIIYYKHPYYLTPTRPAQTAYALFAKAMAEMSRVGLARLILHDREQYAVLRPIDGAICLITLHYDEDLAPFEELRIDDSVRPANMDYILDTIEQLTADFRPGKYQDEYSVRLLELIHDKAEIERNAFSAIARKKDNRSDEDFFKSVAKALNEIKLDKNIEIS